MRLNHGIHLAYSTNVHRGETWCETLDSLVNYTLAVRQKVCPQKPFAIGLRLSHQAAIELSDPITLLEFQRWLEKNSCYVFTINGFPFGRFHGTRVKENVYRPDWTSPERLDYTNLLFDLLAQLLPAGIEGSVSTLPGSFKEFIRTGEQQQIIRESLWKCVEHVAQLAESTGKKLHLGLEPEPLGLIENSRETVRFFEQLRDEHPRDPRLGVHLGVNYDTCHFAVEFEEPRPALAVLRDAGIRISKIHLSSALKTIATPEARAALKQFADDVYLHQVVARNADGTLKFHRDLPDALANFPNFQLRRMAHSFSRPAARARRAAAPKHKRPSARRTGRARGNPGPLHAPRNGDLHLGSAAAGIEIAQRRRAACGGIPLDTLAPRRARPHRGIKQLPL